MARNPLAYLGITSLDNPGVVRKSRAPTSADKTNYNLGKLWIDTSSNSAYILVEKSSTSATWEAVSGAGLSFQDAVLSKAVAYGAAVATVGNRYIAPATAGTWTQNYIYEYTPSGTWAETVAAEGMAAYIKDIDEVDAFDGAAWANLVSPVTTLKGLSDTDIDDTVAYSDADILVYDAGAAKWENHPMTGDIVVTNAGVTSFNGSPIVNADVNAAAAIAYSKLGALASANILVGSAGNVATVTPVTGDVSIDNTGLTSVSDLTMAGEVIGNILYFDGANWVPLVNGAAGLSLLSNGVGSNPTWGAPSVTSASSIANNATLNDAGAFDAILSFTTQTVGAPTLTVPDFASVNDTFVFTTLAQTLANKTLTSPVLNTAISGTAFLDQDDMSDDSATKVASQQSIKAFVETTAVTMASKTLTAPKIATTDGIFDGGGDEYLTFTESATPVNYLNITSSDTGVNPSLNATGSDANVGLLLYGKGTGKVTIADSATPTKMLNVELVGATATKTMTLVSSHTDDRSITYPDATDTLVGKATTDTLTNKTIDADGTGNVLSNINADETDPIATDNYGMPFTIVYDVSNAATTSIYTADAPFKFRIIDVWTVNTSAGNSGTWKIDNGAADVTTAVNYGAGDTSIVRAASIDDATHEIASGGSLRCINSVATDDAILYINCIRFA